MMKQWQEFARHVHELYNSVEFIPLHEPTFNGNELSYVSDCVTSGWVSSVGQYVDRFEHDLAQFVGTKRAVAVVNGTAALHISLLLVGVERGDEVLVPSLTFVATANAISYIGAIPHFIDVEERTLGVDSKRLSHYLEDIVEWRDDIPFNRHTGRKIAAIVPMHTFGHAVDLHNLQRVSEKYHIPIVEDAAESLGTTYEGKQTGSFGKVGAISFNGNKIVTTGGGGAIVTNDEQLADRAKHLTTTAKVPHRWEYVHDEVAYNYRMPNLNAALGCAQLENLPMFIEQKRQLTNDYAKLVESLQGVRLYTEVEEVRSNYWLQTLILEDCSLNRDEILQWLNDANVMSRPIWKPLHTLSMYKQCPKMELGVTEQLEHRIINIPSTPIGR